MSMAKARRAHTRPRCCNWAVFCVALGAMTIALDATASVKAREIRRVKGLVRSHATRVGLSRLPRTFTEGTLPRLSSVAPRYAPVRSEEAARLYLPVDKRALEGAYRGPAYRGFAGQRQGPSTRVWLQYVLRREPRNATGLTWSMIEAVKDPPRSARTLR